MPKKVVESWFPKVVFLNDAMDVDHLLEHERNARAIASVSSTYRDDFLNVGSTHRTNSALHLDARFGALATLLLNDAADFADVLGYERQALHIQNMWANISTEGDFLFPHTHSGSLISGVYYIKAPANSFITFYNDLHSFFPQPVRFNDLNYPTRQYACIAGRLLMFRSDLVHGNGRQGPGEKIAISFNIGY